MGLTPAYLLELALEDEDSGKKYTFLTTHYQTYQNQFQSPHLYATGKLICTGGPVVDPVPSDGNSVPTLDKPDPKVCIEAAFHWLKESITALLSKNDFGTASKLTSTLDSLYNAIPPGYRTSIATELPVLPELNPLNLTKTEMDLYREGYKINAIKEVRGRTGLGLKEAKDLIEAWAVAANLGGTIACGNPFQGKVNALGVVVPGFTA